MTDRQVGIFVKGLVERVTSWLASQKQDRDAITAPYYVQLFAKTLAQEYVTSMRHTRRPQAAERPIATVSVANDRAKYEAECAALLAQGYKLVSASCSAHGREGTTDEFFMAVFAKE